MTRYICLSVADAIKIVDDIKDKNIKNKIKSQVISINKKPFDAKAIFIGAIQNSNKKMAIFVTIRRFVILSNGQCAGTPRFHTLDNP